MKKIGITATLFAVLAALASVNCGDPCGDYKTKADACCDKTPATASLCKGIVDAAVKNANSDACQQASDLLGDNCGGAAK